MASELIAGKTAVEIKDRLKWCSSSIACNECIYNSNHEFCSSDTVIHYALALIERLEGERDAALVKAPRWISTEDRLPEGECLAIGWQDEMLIGNVYRSGAGYACESDGEYLMDVTHWMPLPSTEGLK